MIEFGIAAKNLPLKRRATERLPIFIGAALALILTRRRILLFAVIPGIVTVIESRYWSETAGGQLPDSLLDPMWIGHVAVILMRDILGIFFACALTATVFDLLRGRRFAFRPGFATARRNLRSLALIAAFLATIEILSLLLFNGDNRLIPSGFQAASVGFILQWGPFLVMYFSIPIIADVGGNAIAAMTVSLKLLRIVWTDAVVLAIAAAVVVIALLLASLPLFLLEIIGTNDDGGPNALGEVIGATLTTLSVTFSGVYTARLYLFARSIDTATAKLPGTTAP